MRKQVLLSATALLATIGLASAQGASQGVSGASKASTSVSESPSAPQDRAAGEKRNHGQDEGKSHAQNRSQDKAENSRSQQSLDYSRAKSKTSAQAQDEGRPQRSNGEAQRSQAEKRLQRDDLKKERRSSQAQDKGEQGRKGEVSHDNAKAARDKSQGDQTNGQATQRRSGEKNQQSLSETSGRGAEPQPVEKTESRAGNSDRAQARGVSLTADQQTKIQSTVIANRDVPHVNQVNFSVAVGTIIPDSIEIIDVPPALVEIYPQWRGNSVLVVHDEIVIVDHSRKIVAVVPAPSSRAATRDGSSRIGNGEAAIADLGPDKIREVQLVLIQRGLLVGEADGIFGPDTRAALVKFQRDSGIETTGSIDVETVNRMKLSDKLKAQGALGKQPSQAKRSGAQQPAGQKEQKSEPQQETTGQGGPAVGGGSRNSQPNMKDEQPPSGTPGTQHQRDGDLKERPSGNRN